MSRTLANRYELLEQIGEGGMAVVYKSKDKLLNRNVAIKILKPEFTKDLKLIDNFKKESQAAASLVHQNIVAVYDVGREGNINYIVMELVEGRILSDIIKEEAPLDYRRVIDIGRQIAAGLSCAHKNNIIHKDVKPHNVLVTNDGIAKITDFGIAKITDSSTISGKSDMVMGSVHYFSPEQARGGYVDEKSDIYSLGIVLYEMITGNVPFDGKNPVNVALMHINDEMPRPSDTVKDIPTALEHIIMKATSKLQINRFKSADEMMEALKNVDLISDIVGEAVYIKSAKNESIEEEQEVQALSKDKSSKGLGAKSKGQGKESKKSSGKPSFKLNKIKVAAIVAALILAVPVSTFIYNILNDRAEEVEVPDLKGKTLIEAQRELEALGFVLEEGDRVYSSDYEEGIIVSQSPDVGTKGKSGKIISVSISKGNKEGTVPSLLGKTFDEAISLIRKYGYEVGEVTIGESEAPKDTVISQEPKAGKTAKAGKAITFVVSKGVPEGMVKMPKLLGLSQEKAKAALKEAELEVGDISEDISTAYDKNQVMWQQFDIGTMVNKGSKVNFKVSTGTEPSGPRTVLLDLDFSEAKNQVFFLTVTVSDESGTFNVLSREQRFKEDGGEIVTLIGKGRGTVTVIFDDSVVLKKNIDFNTGAIQ